MRLQTKRNLLEIILVASALISTQAVAQLTRQQTQTYTLSPNSTVAVQGINLGTIQGGAPQASQTFPGVLTVTLTQSGSYTVAGALQANSTSFAFYEVYVVAPGGQACDLRGGSSTSSIPTCSWTLTGPGTFTYGETIVYQANDGLSFSGHNTVTFTLA